MSILRRLSCKINDYIEFFRYKQFLQRIPFFKFHPEKTIISVFCTLNLASKFFSLGSNTAFRQTCILQFRIIVVID